MADFWQYKSLADMTAAEWESLCDRCGRCCLLKLEDVDSGEMHFTSIACRHLQQPGCQCDCYANRLAEVPECLALTPQSLPDLIEHLPGSCAYRRLAEGRSLPQWHPLISGDPDTVVQAGIAIEGRVISEAYIHPEQYEEHIILWHQWEGDE